MRKIYDPMEFQPGMQQIDSDIFDRVIAARKAYQPEQYTARQVKAALQKEELSFEDFAALLSPGGTAVSGTDGSACKDGTGKALRQQCAVIYAAVYFQLLREPVRLLRFQLQKCHHSLQAERRGN